MPESERSVPPGSACACAAIISLLALTGVMLFALFTRTPPHPPVEVAPFAIGPFLGASVAIGAAALYLVRHGGGHGAIALALLFAATALVSFGPQKYVDPAFGRIWPTVITAQVAVVVLLGWCVIAARRKRPGA